jgi:hypothetical protein
MVVVVPFSLAATVVTFLTLDPFLKHPWYELAYWIANYATLCICAPLAFALEERAAADRGAPGDPLRRSERTGIAIVGAWLLVFGASLLFELGLRSSLWPFPITPLVSRILGVWLCSLALAHAWAALEGDRRRARPLFVASPATGALLALVPLIHRGDLANGAGALAAYLSLALGLVAMAAPLGAARLHAPPTIAGKR